MDHDRAKPLGQPSSAPTGDPGLPSRFGSGLSDDPSEKTGLPRSATAAKLRWMRNRISARLRRRAVDAWVLWNLTGGRPHDRPLNASPDHADRHPDRAWDENLRDLRHPPGPAKIIDWAARSRRRMRRPPQSRPVPIRASSETSRAALRRRASLAERQRATFSWDFSWSATPDRGSRRDPAATVGWRIAGKRSTLEGSALCAAISGCHGLGFLSSAPESGIAVRADSRRLFRSRARRR